MPYRRHVGSTDRSISRTRIEYGGCSHRNRSRTRRSATHCASTMCSAGNVDEPAYRIFPWWTRSLSAPSVSSTSAASSGRWTWYRSIQSVSSRRRLLSTSRWIQRRELPRMFGSWPIGACTLVASTRPSRRPAIALPTISSDSPAEYTSAVSTKLIPASNARCAMRTQSSWPGLPHLPNIMAPRQYSLTRTPVLPRVRISMRTSLRAPRSCLTGAETRDAGLYLVARGIGEDRQVRTVLYRQRLGARDLRARVLAVLGRDVRVGGPVDEQRRCPDLVEMQIECRELRLVVFQADLAAGDGLRQGEHELALLRIAPDLRRELLTCCLVRSPSSLTDILMRFFCAWCAISWTSHFPTRPVNKRYSMPVSNS